MPSWRVGSAESTGSLVSHSGCRFHGEEQEEDEMAPEGVADPTEDERRLAELGYEQELERGWTRFTNFAISFSIISVLAGCFTTFYVGWNSGGPLVLSIRLPVLGLFLPPGSGANSPPPPG